jgi:hypothetical protein
MALGQIQLKQLNQPQISGFVAQVAATGVVVRPENTGDFIDTRILNNTGTILWNRDLALSGLLGNATGNINIKLGATGQTLWGRDIELSNNIAALSGSADAGATGQTLWLRDAGLSSNLSSVSGQMVASGATLNATGLSLFNRDVQLSANLATLSGSVVLSSATGDFLDPTDTAALELRDTNLSANVATLSGAVAFKADTGDFLDPTDTIALELRDTNLSSDVATLSGVTVTTSDTGLFLTQANSGHTVLLFLSGIEIAATETNTLTVDGVEIVGGGGDLTHASGTLLFDRDTVLSDNVALVSGLAGGWDHASGTILWDRDDELGDNLATLSGNVVFSSETGGFLDHASGTLLFDRDTALSDNVATLSGNVAFSSETGGFLDHVSGTLLFDRDTELSDNVASVSGLIGPGGGGSAPIGSTKTAVHFHATKDYIAPGTGWASPFYGTGYEFIRFQDSTVDGERALYQGIIPEGVDLNVGLNVTLFWHPSTNSTDDVAWLTEFKVLDNLDNENWGTPITTVDSALGTEESIQSVTAIHSASEIDSLQTGDTFLLRVTRSGLLGADTMSDYANLHAIHIQSPVSRTITKTFDQFHAPTFTAPATGFGQLDYVSGVRTLQLHPDSGEAGMYDSIIPENIDLSNGINVTLHWFPEEANVGDVAFLTAFGRRDVIGDDNFGTEKSGISTAGTAGWLQKTYINHGAAEIGGLVSGDFYRLKVGRSGDAGNDDMAGNAHITYIQLETP